MNWKQTPFYLVVTLATVLLFVLVLYILPLLPILLTIGYFSVAMWNGWTECTRKIEEWSPRTYQEEVECREARERAANSWSGWIDYYGNRVGQLFLIASNAMVWPISWSVGYVAGQIKRWPKLDVSEPELEEEVNQHIEAGLLFAFLLAWIVLGALFFRGTAHENYIVFFVLTILASLLLNLVAWSLKPGGLPALLRQLLGRHAWKVFAAVLILDTLTLLVGLSYVKATTLPNISNSTLGLLQVTSYDLFVFRSLWNIVDILLYGKHGLWQGLLSGLATIVFYSSFLRHLYSAWASFTLNNKDLLQLAAKELRRHKPDDALGYLDNLKDATIHSDEAIALRATSHMFRLDWEKAKQEAMEHLHHHRDHPGFDGDRERSEDRICLLHLLLQRFPPNELVENNFVMHTAKDPNCPDWLASTIAAWCFRREERRQTMVQLLQGLSVRETRPILGVLEAYYSGRVDAARECAELLSSRPAMPRHAVVELQAEIIRLRIEINETGGEMVDYYAQMILERLRSRADACTTWVERVSLLHRLHELLDLVEEKPELYDQINYIFGDESMKIHKIHQVNLVLPGIGPLLDRAALVSPTHDV